MMRCVEKLFNVGNPISEVLYAVSPLSFGEGSGVRLKGFCNYANIL